MKATVHPGTAGALYLDSGCGQCIFNNTESFSYLQSCLVEVTGVASSVIIRGEGTVRLLLRATNGKDYVGIIHNCLQGSGDHDLMSVSQIQSMTANMCSLDNQSPVMKIGSIDFKLLLVNGLYQLPYILITPGDPRLYRLPQVVLTPPGPFVPVSTDSWNRHIISPSQPVLFGRTVPILIADSSSTFHEELISNTGNFHDPTRRSPDRRTFDPSNPDDLVDLSVRFMGVSGERLKHTLLISRGLSSTTTNDVMTRHIRTNLFPQGNMKSNRPYIYKGKIQLLHKASIGEVLFTDTFLDDPTYHYGQAFVCYRSRYGKIIPLKSRTQIGSAFAQFCADNFTPLLLIRDNISENTGGDLLQQCIQRDVQSAFICPYKPQMDFAENYLGRVCGMASYAMVYAGAPLFLWRYAILAAAFVNNITATYYSKEDVWATPYELVFGEPYPNTGIVMPFGCAALILLPKEDRTKFRSRCAMVIFIHYADHHPHATYAFYSPSTRRILFRQDCIFLVDVFPMRAAMSKTNYTADGDILVPYKPRRPPPSVVQNSPPEFSFDDWCAPLLPKFDDHISGHISTDSDPVMDISTDAVPDISPSSFSSPSTPPSFGPPSAVPVLQHVPQAPLVELSSIGTLSTSLSSTDSTLLHEDQAAALVGERFFDDEFGWCTVTGFGTEGGCLINFWTPDATGAEEEWSTHAEVSTWISTSRSSTQRRTSKKRQHRRQRKIKTRKAYIMKLPPPGTLHATECKDKYIVKSCLRNILRLQVSIFKYGVQIPRNDTEANNSPERVQWKAGRDLEWMRLQQRGTFGESYTWSELQHKFPSYQKSDIGKTFFVYDFKHSGEHRVRLVFDGSQQSEATYSETYAPTVRSDSIRLFHLYNVEMNYDIKQYDVPQAFLQSEIDHLIFVYPPRGYASRPGELLRLHLGLYGAKQSAAIWANTLRTFLLKLNFVSSDMDPCFYKRVEPSGELTLLISYVDDFRIGGPDSAIQEVYDAMFKEWGITSCSGNRFLGLDVTYDRTEGRLVFSMQTYLRQTIERFDMADISKGLPYRNLVGCLMWLACSVFGTVLTRVKELARHCNSYTLKEYNIALKLLRSLDPTTGIVFLRGGAYREQTPQLTRRGGVSDTEHDANDTEGESDHFDGFDIASTDVVNEFGLKDLYRDEDSEEKLKEKEPDIPPTKRFRIIGYSDAAFAVNDLKQSVSGWVIYLNGTPLLFGSLKQSVVVDSSCSAEYVAASVCVKKIMELENMLAFLNIRCEKPYTMYTDSMACKHIADNKSRMGKVRHLAIRTHLVRCHVSMGDINLVWCTTESMVADVMTKIVSGAQDKRLASRFYNDVDTSLQDLAPETSPEEKEPIQDTQDMKPCAGCHPDTDKN